LLFDNFKSQKPWQGSGEMKFYFMMASPEKDSTELRARIFSDDESETLEEALQQFAKFLKLESGRRIIVGELPQKPLLRDWIIGKGFDTGKNHIIPSAIAFAEKCNGQNPTEN
jgi:hypothetical protein